MRKDTKQLFLASQKLCRRPMQLMTKKEKNTSSKPSRLLFKCIRSLFFLLCFACLFTACDASKEVITNIDEKEANIILVLLESRQIPASKLALPSGTMAGAGGSTTKYKILVPKNHMISAISYLNQNGFPRQKGTNLLTLFAKQGMMTSDKEETIRYQAGLAQQLVNTILMIDGVIDASVQLSFPEKKIIIPGEPQTEKITAAVYVKHQGIIDDPNIHLENKIKRLISGSISGLDVNDVTVISDLSRFTDITLKSPDKTEETKTGNYVSIWSIVMSADSAFRFRFLFFLIITITVGLALILGWLIWKFYPTLKTKGAIKELFSPLPWLTQKKQDKPPEEEP